MVDRLRDLPGDPFLPSAGAAAVDAGLDCRVLTDFSELERYSADWSRLQTSADRGEIFQDFNWIQAWWQELRKDSRLFAPIVLRHDRVVAILPLVLAQRRLQFLAHSVSDYNHFLAEPGESRAALEMCLDSLLERKSDWDEIRLDNVPESSLLNECLRDLPRRWQRWLVRMDGGSCPTLLLGENRQETLKTLLSKESLKRPVRRFKRLGKLGFRHIEDRSEISNHFGQFLQQHIRRSAMAGRRSNFLAEDYISFYKNLLDRLDPRVEIRFSVLTLDDRPIAYHFGTLSGSKYLWYKPAFDVDLWELSPGQVLLWHLFEHLQTIEAREFDFGLGDESFKFRFCNQVRQNLRFSILVPGYRSALRKTAWSAMESVRKRVRNAAALHRIAKALHEQCQDLRLSYQRKGLAAALAKFFGDKIYRREEAWLVSVDASAGNVPAQSQVVVDKTTLGGLADLALAFPDILTEEQLMEARQLLRQEMTAWVARVDGSPRMILWTSIGTELQRPNGAIPLSEKTLILSEIWSLTADAADRFMSMLRQTADIAKDMNLPAAAVCPGRLLPPRQTLPNAGIRPLYRLQHTRFFGKDRWKQHEFR